MTRPSPLRRLWVGLAAAALLAAAACSVPEDSRPRALDYSQLPDDLLATTEPPEPTPLVTQEVLIYLIDESNLLSAIARDVASPARPITVLETLFSAPNEAESEQALSTALPADAEVVSVEVDRPNDLVTVALESEVFEERLEGENRQLAVAQLVFTATETTGTARFSLLLNGNPVPLPTDSGESDVTRYPGRLLLGGSRIPARAHSRAHAGRDAGRRRRSPETPTPPPEPLTPTPPATPTAPLTTTTPRARTPTLPPGMPPDFSLDF